MSMRPPTGNEISQKQHGAYKAVDYHSHPDPYIYAPEDGTVVATIQDAGDAGKELMVLGAHGRHGFCHCEEFYVKVGEHVKKGQRIAKMGYTGKTDPPGPGGRHVHHVIKQSDGTYVYPPSITDELFISSPEEENVIDLNYKPVAELVTLLTTGWPDPYQDGGEFVKSIMANGQVDVKGMEKLLNNMLGTPQRRDLINAVNAPKQITPEQQKKLNALEVLKEALK